MSEKLVNDFKAARRVSTPLLAVTTADPGATVDLLAATIENKKDDAGGTVRCAALVWDCVHGLQPMPGRKDNEAARKEIGIDGMRATSFKEVLAAIEREMPANTVLFVMNAHLAMKDGGTVAIQGIWNLRDPFKLNKRMLVLMGIAMPLPKELEHDVIVLDEPLPTNDVLKMIVTRQHQNAGLPAPKADVLERTVDALAGLSAFPAEQVTAMSLTKDGVGLDAVWERKRKSIEQTPGLSVWRGAETFDAIGGYANVQTFIRRLGTGPNRPAGIVFMDEIEKMFAGSRGDNTGVSQGQHMAILTFMQDHGARGMLFVGHPGAGKSAVAKAAGNLMGVPTIQLDLGAMKSSGVGDSEAATRNALKVIQAVCQGRALFIATCNSLDGLSPELRRRFRNGTFFFDLPDAKERAAIWNIYLKRYKMDPKKTTLPHDTGWTGSEIENCCDQAFSINGTLEEASQFIVPQAVAMKEHVERRRKEAEGSIISASYPGTYRGPLAGVDISQTRTPGGGRTIELDN